MNSRPGGASMRPVSNFIREIIDADRKADRHDRIVTRFPPEPNGYLHIGHAKSIVLNFGIARDYEGQCHLRFDDTNPETENEEYVESIKESVRWLGFDWGEHLYFASDYFEQFFEYAIKLIRNGDAYVDSLSDEDIRLYRGTVTEPGEKSPFRDRTPDENEELFRRMRQGDFADGRHVLRAKIDMSSVNMKMRDPLLYRIKHAHHYRTGDAWCIYPMYDFAHPLEDAIEGITHSLCTLEFENNRELYDWVLEHCLEASQLSSRPHQYEFARLNVDYTVMSKRKLLRLVDDGFVSGWDDPRMPTLAGMRRGGVPPHAIRSFCEQVGVTRTDSRTDIGLLEHTIRDTLNHEAPRVMAVVEPLKVVLTNYPEDQSEELEASYWPHDVPKEGSRRVPFGRELYVERDDFSEDPPKGFFRLSPGQEVRLRYAYLITCQEVIKNDAGDVVELRCTYDPDTQGGDAPDGRKVRGTIHWVSATEGVPAEFRLYDRLFEVADPEEGEAPFTERLNEQSLKVRHGFIEPSVLRDASDQRYQFERLGYYWRDPEDSSGTRPVFNRIVPLRDSWAKKKERPAPSPPTRAKKKSEAPAAQRTDPVELLDTPGRARFDHLVAHFDVASDDAAVLAADASLTEFFRDVAAETAHHQAALNWILHELRREMKARSTDSVPVGPRTFAELIELLEANAINSSAGQTVLGEMMESEERPEQIVERHGLRQMSDDSDLIPIVDSVLAEYHDRVEAYRSGKTGLLGFFTGQVMRRTQGRANPELTQSLLHERLDS